MSAHAAVISSSVATWWHICLCPAQGRSGKCRGTLFPALFCILVDRPTPPPLACDPASLSHVTCLGSWLCLSCAQRLPRTDPVFGNTLTEAQTQGCGQGRPREAPWPSVHHGRHGCREKGDRPVGSPVGRWLLQSPELPVGGQPGRGREGSGCQPGPGPSEVQGRLPAGWDGA